MWHLTLVFGIITLVTCGCSPRLDSDSWRPWYVRVGEADNPGPARVDRAALMTVVEGHGDAVKRTDAPAGATVQYPQPFRDGFDDIFLPGAQPPPRPVPPGDLFSLQLESYNGSGWRQLKQRLKSTTAHAVMAQETWLSQAAIAPASRWAARHGWKAVWAPAGKRSTGRRIWGRGYLCQGLARPWLSSRWFLHLAPCQGRRRGARGARP